MPTEFPRIDIVDIPGKGKGVIAKGYIPGGTLIISERPRILLPYKDPTQALSALSREDLSFLLSFPRGPDEHPIFGRLKHFTPCVGDDTFSRGLCETICRVNHTCYSPKARPNAAYYWNTSSKEEELRALKEIHEGEEIQVSYMEDIQNYEDPLAQLRQKFAFDCSCPGCVRPAAERCASKERILAYNNFVERLPKRFGQENPLGILKDIETQILIICEEGYTSEIGSRAHDAFQLCAYYGDADSAQKWESISRDSHALYQGPTSEPFKESKKLAGKPQGFRAWQQLGRRKLRGPSKRVLEYFYPKDETTKATPNEGSSRPFPTSAAASAPSTSASEARTTPAASNEAASSSVVSTKPSTSTEKILRSKGQKKKAKAKAKKEAARDAGENSGLAKE
ncbi:hypothetical protein B0H17DRAFT_1135988 [Mycena rosella]|uniref:SET domain-containing protein n=1 Tax=Mycena rosella TaxID=1033263 RepID=A0AAD7GEW8_MYCRO|nr:hypothetical protein B0H17DRAFT_1135988 [Mycena rosella]